MNRTSITAVGAILSIIFSVAAQAQSPSMAARWGLYVYPAQGQPLQKMQMDEIECVEWARNATGVDPNNPGAGVSVAQTPDGGTGVAAASGAVRGAATAGLIGNVAGKDASKWAAYGAAVGAARGASGRKAQNDQAAARAQADAQAQAEQRMEQFRDAFSVCMRGRDYSVSGGS